MMKSFAAAALLAFAMAAAPVPATAAQKTVVLSVPGMNCAACPITVRKALQKVPGVAAVKATLSPPEAVVTFEDSAASVEQLMEATRNAGYPSSLKSGN
jgi:mercuric ion binding protein